MIAHQEGDRYSCQVKQLHDKDIELIQNLKKSSQADKDDQLGEEQADPIINMSSKLTSLLSSPTFVFSSAIILRVFLLFYGLHQDAHSAFKYTDIDYYVFTDASRFISQGRSPYDRDTYRYTPLLAWLLLPTSWTSHRAWFSFGKVLFALADVIAGYLILFTGRT